MLQEADISTLSESEGKKRMQERLTMQSTFSFGRCNIRSK